VVLRSSDYVVESKSDSEVTEFFAYENVLLFLAADPESALRMAGAKGKQEEEAGDNTLTRNGNPAALRFGGVWKIVECQPQSAVPMQIRDCGVGRIMVSGLPLANSTFCG
jgi:hypothetical protein